MCNRKHEDSKVPRVKNGKGYKIFSTLEDDRTLLRRMVLSKLYTISENGWIDWRSYHSDGFCIFTSLKEAKICLRNWIKSTIGYPTDIRYSIYRIEYKRAIASHVEYSIVNRGKSNSGYNITLVKSFKILEEISNGYY